MLGLKEPYYNLQPLTRHERWKCPYYYFPNRSRYEEHEICALPRAMLVSSLEYLASKRVQTTVKRVLSES